MGSTFKDGDGTGPRESTDFNAFGFISKLGDDNIVLALGFRELQVNTDLISRYFFDSAKTFYAVTFSGRSPDEGARIFSDNREYWFDLVNRKLIDSVFAEGDQITVVWAVGSRAEAEDIMASSPLANATGITRTPLKEIVL